MDEIQVRIIEELGPFAIILFSRTVSAGFFTRLFFGNHYEVTIGIEEEDYEHHKKGIAAQFKQPNLNFGFSETQIPIPVSGPVPFDLKVKNIIFLVGSNDIEKAATTTKLAIKWKKETGLNVDILALGTLPKEEQTQIESFSSIFQLNYRLAPDEKNLNAFITASPSKIFLVLLPEKHKSVALNQPAQTTTLLVLNAESPPEKQIDEIDLYADHHLFGLIYIRLEKHPSLLFLEKLFTEKQIPVSYLLEGSEVKLANAEDIHTRIINEKLAKS